MLCCSNYGMYKAFDPFENNLFSLKQACVLLSKQVEEQKKNDVIRTLQTIPLSPYLDPQDEGSDVFWASIEERYKQVHRFLPDQFGKELKNLIAKTHHWALLHRYGLAYPTCKIAETQQTPENADILNKVRTLVNFKPESLKKSKEYGKKLLAAIDYVVYQLLQLLGEDIERKDLNAVNLALRYFDLNYKGCHHTCEICNVLGNSDSSWYGDYVHEFCSSLMGSIYINATSIRFNALCSTCEIETLKKQFDEHYDKDAFNLRLAIACGHYKEIYGNGGCTNPGFTRFIELLQKKLGEHSILDYVLTHGETKYAILCRDVFTIFDLRNKAMLAAVEKLEKDWKEGTGFFLEEKKDAGN